VPVTARSVGHAATITDRTPGPSLTTFKLAGASAPVPSRLFRRGQPAFPPVAIWQNGTNGCIPIVLGRNFEYFELGSEIAATDHAAGAVHRVSGRCTGAAFDVR